MEQNPQEKQSKPDLKKGAPVGATLRSFKDYTEEKWTIVKSMDELWNNSVSKEKIVIRGNLDINFDITESPDVEINGDLRCKSISGKGTIYVGESLKGDAINMATVRAASIVCSSINCGEIAAHGEINSNEIAGNEIRAHEIHVTNALACKMIYAKRIYAGSITASQIIAEDVEAKTSIDCDTIKAKRAKAQGIFATFEKVIDEIVETGPHQE